MKEIKFRAWDKEKMYFFTLKDIWKEGCEQQLSELNDPKRLSLNSEYPYSNCILMQYTGLKDKNGKEIYEGDVLIDNNNWDEHKPTFRKQRDIFIVKWNEEYTGWNFKNTRGKTNSITMTESKELEIIGNMHQNPELLKEDLNEENSTDL